MVKNPLVKSVIVVTVTWWTGLTAISKDPLSAIPQAVVSLTTTVSSALLGFGAMLLLFFLGRRAAISNISGTTNRGLSITMGTLPVGIGPPARAVGTTLEEDGTRLSRWYQEAKVRHPSHARLFEACLQIYARHHDLPASPVRGGHGGIPLLNHALHVAEVTLELAESWTYDGERTEKGDLRIPLSDPEYVFDRHDPLIPVLALAHDIGKIECYAEVDGQIKEFRQDHDMVSGLMLARTPETWRLDTEDRTDLLLAVSHYHHPSYLPTHATDRVRAMMNLLIAADVKASTEEGIPDIAKAWKELAEQPSELELIWDVFCDLLAVPGSINGQDRENRIGYKNGAFLYLFEEKTRHAIARAMGNERAADKSSRRRDGRYQISDLLMQVLEEKGLLYSTHKGKKYSHTKALFKVTFHDPRNEEHSVTVPAVIILKLGNPVLSRFDKYPDSRLEPRTVEPLFSPAAGKQVALQDAQEPSSEVIPTQDSQPAANETDHPEPEASTNTKAVEPAKSPRPTKQATKREGKAIVNPGLSKQLLDQMDDPMKSLELLMQSTQPRTSASKKSTSREEIPDYVVKALLRIHASLEGGMVRYHDNTNDGFLYIKRDQVVEDMISDETRTWIETARHPQILFKASEKARYLLISNDVLKNLEK